ncbi:hypothetical protein BASA50_009113 [Batrachochytrium salamandrivorans]|uniref:RZZ complex subunit KNTC1/ROD C-terminal domain-containing protein n=1 Tax=Batrachochytrium salamandrivorans TaxID=1357716 RepID=A0ABQ8F2U3_9FUNG|nr:hypothetical protein BASA62_000690 [Batrachochytrium salamandrivorans]KAH6591111.1 hypothetical protein BASA50_009113 [Batrachochytrium salamandrivorans]
MDDLLLLPTSEADFMSMFAPMAHAQRNRSAARLAHTNRDRSALTVLLQSLLTCSADPIQPETVPYLVPDSTLAASSSASDPNSADDSAGSAAAAATDDDGENSGDDNDDDDAAAMSNADSDDSSAIKPTFVVAQVKLRYPILDITQRHLQRILAIRMALVAGNQIDLLLSVLPQPSQVGKSIAILACAKGASDEQLHMVFDQCSPSVQLELIKMLNKLKRYNALGLINSPLAWKASLDLDSRVPLCTLLRTRLEKSSVAKRKSIWRDIGLVEHGSDVIQELFKLTETFPPRRPLVKGVPMDQFHLPYCVESRMYHFLDADPERTFKLVVRMCIYQRESNETKFSLDIPKSLFKRRRNSLFKRYKEKGSFLDSFINIIFDFKEGVLISNGEFLRAGLIEQCSIGHLDLILRRTQALMELKDPWAYPCLVSACLKVLLEGVISASHRKDKVLECKRLHSRISDWLKTFLLMTIELAQKSSSSDTYILNQVRLYFILPIATELSEYPPIAQELVHHIRDLITPFREKETLGLICVQLFLSLSAKSDSIFDLPRVETEHLFSSIPPWSNEELFNLALSSLPLMTNISTWKTIAKSLTVEQRQRLFSSVSNQDLVAVFTDTDPAHRADFHIFMDSIGKDPSITHAAASMLLKTIGNNLSVADTLQLDQYLDICIPSVRTRLESNLNVPVWKDRFERILTLNTVTLRSKSSQELIKSLKCIVSCIKNEASEKLAMFGKKMLVPFDITYHHCTKYWMIPGEYFPRIYVQDLDTVQVPKLAKVLLKLQRQNFESAAEVDSITLFVTSFAEQAISRNLHNPTHPMFKVGVDLLWNEKLHRHGLTNAFTDFNIIYDHVICEVGDEEEHRYRTFKQYENKMDDDITNKVGSLGFDMIPIGQEAAVVEAIVQHYSDKYSLLGCGEFELSDSYALKMLDFLPILETRAMASPRIVCFLDAQLDLLDPIIMTQKDGIPCGLSDWPLDGIAIGVPLINHVDDFVRYFLPEYLQKTPPAWYSRFLSLKFRSTSASREINRIAFKYPSKLAGIDAVANQFLSIDKSALALRFVSAHLFNTRQDLLDDNRIDAMTGYLGNFTASSLKKDAQIVSPYTVIAKFPERLSTHQSNLISKMLLETALSDNWHMKKRISAIKSYMRFPTTTICDVANILAHTDLDPKLVSSIIQYMPELAEPRSTIQFLTSKAYLQSDFSHAAIQALHRSLMHLPASQISATLLPLFPAENAPDSQFPTTTLLKGLVRILLSFFYIPEHQEFFHKLWSRKSLHRSVRAAIVQVMMSLLNSKNTTVSTVAWDFLSSVSASKEHHLNGAIFPLLVTHVETDGIHPIASKFSRSAAGIESQLAFQLDYIAEFGMPNAISGEYAKRILWPIILSDFTSSKHKLQLDLYDIRIYAIFLVLASSEQTDIDEGSHMRDEVSWITESNAHTFASDFLSVGRKILNPKFLSDVTTFKSIDEILSRRQVILRATVLGIVSCASQSSGATRESIFGMLFIILDDLALCMDDSSTPFQKKKDAYAMILGIDIPLCIYSSTAGFSWKDVMGAIKALVSTSHREDAFHGVFVQCRIASLKTYCETTHTADSIVAEALDILQCVIDYARRFNIDVDICKENLTGIMEHVDSPDTKNQLAVAILDQKLFEPFPWSLEIEHSIIFNYTKDASMIVCCHNYLHKVVSAKSTHTEHMWSQIADLITKASHVDVDYAVPESLVEYWNRHPDFTTPFVSRVIESTTSSMMSVNSRILWKLLVDMPMVVINRHSSTILGWVLKCMSSAEFLDSEQSKSYFTIIDSMIDWIIRVTAQAQRKRADVPAYTIASCLFIEHILTGEFKLRCLSDYIVHTKEPYYASYFPLSLIPDCDSQSEVSTFDMGSGTYLKYEPIGSISDIQDRFDMKISLVAELQKITLDSSNLCTSGESSESNNGVSGIHQKSLIRHILEKHPRFPLLHPRAFCSFFESQVNEYVLYPSPADHKVCANIIVGALRPSVRSTVTAATLEWVPPIDVAIDLLRSCLVMGTNETADATKRSFMVRVVVLAAHLWLSSIYNGTSTATFHLFAKTKNDHMRNTAAWELLISEIVAASNGEVDALVYSLPELELPKGMLIL